MKKFVAFLAALVAALVIASPASATVSCPAQTPGAPPGAINHCFYGGLDASSTYLHIGNAETVLSGKIQGNPDPSWTGWIAWVWPSGTVHKWGGTADSAHGDGQPEAVGAADIIYNTSLRRACRFEGIVTGPDTGPSVFTSYIDTCYTY